MISKSVRKTEKSLQKVFVICRYRQEMLYHNRKTTGPQDFFLEVSKSQSPAIKLAQLRMSEKT